MKFFLIHLFIFTCLQGQAAEKGGADLLLDKSGGDDNSLDVLKTGAVKSLSLDNPFLVQLFGAWKAQGNLNFDTNQWVSLVFEKKYEQAAHLITIVETKTPESFRATIEATKLYLFWQLNLPQTFFNAWLKLSSDSNFLNTELGMALDQVIQKNSSQWFLHNAIKIDQDQSVRLEKANTENSAFYRSAQAWNHLRKGESALPWLAKLEKNDPLREPLAQTIVIELSSKGKLGAAAKLLKSEFERKLEKSENPEAIADYYMLLARLLYQAGALDASEQYYSIIPNSSKQYINSKVESLWIALRKNDMPKVKGLLETLKLDVFSHRFLPEVYLVSSIANLKLCQFEETKSAFDSFVLNNKKWVKDVEKNLQADKPELIDSNDYYLKLSQKSQEKLAAEKAKLEKLALKSTEAVVPAVGVQAHWQLAANNIIRTMALNEKNTNYELRKRWNNRSKILEESIKKMRFVKVEFLSMMNRYQELAKKQKGSDKLTTFSAATAKSNQMEYPNDGVVWGDDLFKMTAEVKSLCLAGRK